MARHRVLLSGNRRPGGGVADSGGCAAPGQEQGQRQQDAICGCHGVPLGPRAGSKPAARSSSPSASGETTSGAPRKSRSAAMSPKERAAAKGRSCGRDPRMTVSRI
ncbi:hypothetical protein NY78_1370 [Desulfovibrio sp. TomC]|nr:hypothetical protein NY78_1370 [Desulfovibrio sp. TomC]